MMEFAGWTKFACSSLQVELLKSAIKPLDGRAHKFSMEDNQIINAKKQIILQLKSKDNYLTAHGASEGLSGKAETSSFSKAP